MNVSEIG